MRTVYNQPRDPQSPTIVTTEPKKPFATYQIKQLHGKTNASMAPPEAASQARSVTENDFLRQLGLDGNNGSHVQVYNTMKVRDTGVPGTGGD